MYILATEVLAELVWGHHSVVNQWYESIPNTEIHVSVVSLGMIESAIEDISIVSRQSWRDNLRERKREFRKRGKILEIDLKTSEKWARLRAWNSSFPGLHGDGAVSIEDRLLVATALRHGFAIVDRERSVYDELAASFGLRRVNPYGIHP